MGFNCSPTRTMLRTNSKHADTYIQMKLMNLCVFSPRLFLHYFERRLLGSKIAQKVNILIPCFHLGYLALTQLSMNDN